MGKVADSIDDQVRAFIAAQRMFFVATAPTAPDGHVNASPKGLDCFRVLGARTVAYVDYPGSGVETIAHLRDNGRIVVMFCAFDGSPKILRLHGRGRVCEPSDPDFAELFCHFSARVDCVRSLIVIDVERVSDSCGYGVPLYDYVGERDTLVRWAEKKGKDGLSAYQAQKNAQSIDGLPGLRWAEVGAPRKT
jgi:hypothetical protein